jgi:hypothetical protein
MKKSGKEPVLMMKPSEIGKAATQGVGKKAMMHEIHQQVLEMDRQYQLDVDTMVLWGIRQYTGWGPKKLKDFYLFMFNEHMRMREYYEMDDTYPERKKLKDIGVDIEKWYEELLDKVDFEGKEGSSREL